MASSEPATEFWGDTAPASYDGLGMELGGAFMLTSWVAVGADVVAMPFGGRGWDLSLQPSMRVTGPAGLILGLAFGAVAATEPSISY